MSRRDASAIIAAANPVREAEIGKAAIQEVERKLGDAIARERAAAVYEEPPERAPRRGPRFIAVIFAALVLAAGGALAATGVWNPFGGEHHDAQQQSQPPRGSDVQPGFEDSPPDLPGQSGDEHRSPTALGPTVGTVASPPVVDPVLPRSVEEPAPNSVGVPPPDGVGPAGEPSLEGADPTNPGKGQVGGGHSTEPDGPQNGNPSIAPPPVPQPPMAAQGFDFFIKSGETRQAASIDPFSLEAFCDIRPGRSNFGALNLASSVPGATVAPPGAGPEELISGRSVFSVGQTIVPEGGGPEPISATGEGPVRAVAPDGTTVVAQNLFGALNQAGHPGECNFSGELIQTNQENQ